EFVHLPPGDVLVQCEVLGGLAHGDVDVGQFTVLAGVGPVVGPGLGGPRGTCLGLGVQRVLCVGPRVGGAAVGAGHGLHAGREGRVTFARLDGVHGHAGGLQAGRAVAGDGAPGQVVVAELDGDGLPHVEPLFAAG